MHYNIQLCIIIYNYTILYFLIFSNRWKHDAASNIWWFTKSLPLTATANYSEKFPRFHDFSFERAKCWKYFLMTNFPDMFCKLYGQILNYLHLPDMFCKVDFLSSTCAKFPLHTFQEMEFQMPQNPKMFCSNCKLAKFYDISFNEDLIVSKLKILKSLGGSASAHLVTRIKFTVA